VDSAVLGVAVSAPTTGRWDAGPVQADRSSSYRAQRIAAWCGPLFMLFTGLGFVVIAGFIPPVPPSDTARQVADRFIHEQNSIRGGLLLAMFGSTLLCPWYAVTGLVVKRITGADSPWSRTYLIGGTVNVCAFLIPYLIWQTAAFRPEETAPELTQRLDDLAWIPWIGLASPAVMQGLLLAVVILQDRRPVPLLPRWVGYLSALSATSLIPPTFLVFFKTGPLAWNGLAFYISLTCWPTWVFALSFALLRTIKRLEREEPGASIRSDPRSGLNPAEVEAELVTLRRRIDDLEKRSIQPAPPAAPPGPLTTLGPGTSEVGTDPGDTMPGQYRSPGPDADGTGSCYYARLKQNQV
jgi:hypothetical protein